MNCDKCGRVVYANSRRCLCGNKIQPTGNASSPHFFETNERDSSSAFLKISGQKRREIDAYLQSHPGMSKRDTCLTYLREKNLMGALPESIQEALDERAAIQSEGK